MEACLVCLGYGLSMPSIFTESNEAWRLSECSEKNKTLVRTKCIVTTIRHLSHQILISLSVLIVSWSVTKHSKIQERVFLAHWWLTRVMFSRIYFVTNLNSGCPEAESDVTENERMWVMRGRKSAIIVSAVWVTWVVLVQFVFPNQLPSSFYVRDANSFEATGW